MNVTSIQFDALHMIFSTFQSLLIMLESGSGDYHGWDQDGDEWTFAKVRGIQPTPTTFLINDFGGSTTRQALSSIMAAMKQFPGRIHLRRCEKTNKEIDELTTASILRVAPLAGTDDVGVLGVRTKPQPKEPWWKFWKR